MGFHFFKNFSVEIQGFPEFFVYTFLFLSIFLAANRRLVQMALMDWSVCAVIRRDIIWWPSIVRPMWVMKKIKKIEIQEKRKKVETFRISKKIQEKKFDFLISEIRILKFLRILIGFKIIYNWKIDNFQNSNSKKIRKFFLSVPQSFFQFCSVRYDAFRGLHRDPPIVMKSEPFNSIYAMIAKFQ